MSENKGAHKVGVHITGFKEINDALKDLVKSQATDVVRRALVKSAEPVIEAAKALVPVDQESLRESIGSARKLNPRNMRRHRKLGNEVVMFVGPSQPEGAHGVLVEFGTRPHMNKGLFPGTRHPGTAPQPFMRPAWEANRQAAIDRLGEAMWEEIERRVRLNVRAAARKARKAAQLAQRGQDL